MNKQEAINRLKANRDVFVFEETKQALDIAIEALQDDWIPVSEKLPEDYQNVIITYYDTVEKNHLACIGACYSEQDGFVDTGYGDMWFGEDVIAWQPLPEPYNEQINREEN